MWGASGAESPIRINPQIRLRTGLAVVQSYECPDNLKRTKISAARSPSRIPTKPKPTIQTSAQCSLKSQKPISVDERMSNEQFKLTEYPFNNIMYNNNPPIQLSNLLPCPRLYTKTPACHHVSYAPPGHSSDTLYQTGPPRPEAVTEQNW